MRGVPFVLLVVLTVHILPACAQTSTDSETYVFPLFVDGFAGKTTYRSTVKVTKTAATTPLPCTLTQRNTNASFTGVDGNVYDAEVFDAGFSPPAITQLTLDAFLPWEILQSNAQSAWKTGYAKLSCPGPVQAQLQIASFDGPNNKVGEATIVPAVAGDAFRFLINRQDGTRLGFSLANDSEATGQFALIARDRYNYEIDRVYDTIQPWSQVSRFVDEVLALPPNFVGSIELVGLSGGHNYVVGLQFTGLVFSAIPPLVVSEEE